MALASRDDKVLSYGDVTLRKSDIELLEQPEELNDQIIEFFFEHLTAKLAESSQSVLENHPVLLVGPAQTYWLLACPENSLPESTDHMALADRKMVLFALNDNADPTKAEGGTHWSLLAYNRSENVFAHYDSAGGLNLRVAQYFVKRIKSIMRKESDSAVMRQPKTPEQQNAYDCGVYVMKITQVICDAFIQHQKPLTFQDIDGSLQSEVTPDTIHELRQSTLSLIRELTSQSSSKR